MSKQGNYTIIARYKHNESYCNAFNNIGVKICYIDYNK